MERVVDLRSDTVTLPSPSMREAMATAPLGDDVFGEDPSVNRLEEMAADRVGKEAGLFVASGTMGNLVGILSHCQRGDEVICGDQSHVLQYEVAGCAALGGLQLRPVPNLGAELDLDAVERTIRGSNVHFPRTGLIALENTSNRASGAPLSAAETRRVTELAHQHDIPVHLDGARLFNAAVALGVPASDLTSTVDSVTFCLSKGLAAPVGSVLCGTRSYIDRARKFRKMVGGGMRQAGVIAAAGVVALETMVERLAEDHANARWFAEGLAELPGLVIDPATVRTNIVMFGVRTEVMAASEFAKRLGDHGVRVLAIDPTRMRAVTHYGITRSDMESALRAAASVMTTPVSA